MIEVTIEVTGLGECINGEMQVIERALKDAGCNVTVQNEYPHEPYDEKRLENLKGKPITLIANHLPWPG